MGYSIRMDRVKPSAIRSVQKRIASKQGVISFAAGLSDPDLFPMDDLKKSTMEMIEKKGKQAFQYGFSKGNPELLQVLAERMQKKEGVDAKPENIVVTTGSQQGLAMAAIVVDRQRLARCLDFFHRISSSVNGLALSVCFAASSPKGRAFDKSVRGLILSISLS